MSQNVTGNDNLTPDQRRAITALLSAKSVTEAAITTKISRKTLHAWLKQPEFSSALKEAESELLDQSVRRLASLLTDALDELETLLKEGTKETTRLRAVALVLERYFAAKELADLEARIQQLEALNNNVTI